MVGLLVRLLAKLEPDSTKHDQDQASCTVGPLTKTKKCKHCYTLNSSDWSGPGASQLAAHTVASLPVPEFLSATCTLAGLTLPYGFVAHDYLTP